MVTKKSSFREKIARSVDNDQKRASSFGYLNLPKDVSVVKIEDARKYQFDFIPYLVTDEAHPDRDDEYDIATPGTLWYRRPFKIHRNIGSDNEVVVCPKSFGKPCPICEYRSKRMKEEASKEETDALRPSRRHLYAVIPIGHKKLEEKIHIWDYSNALFQDLLDEELLEDEQYVVFPDLQEGYTVEVRFSEESLGKNKFYEASRVNFIEREMGYDESILETVPNLDEVLNVLSYEQLEKMLFDFEGTNDVESDTAKDVPEEEEEKPKRIVRKPKVKPEEEEEEEEPEEEEKPKRTVRKPKKEEEEEEPEEEEEEKPIRRKVPPKEEEKKPTRRKVPPEEEDGVCPHGYRFGIDTELKSECDSCLVWSNCLDAKEANK